MKKHIGVVLNVDRGDTLHVGEERADLWHVGYEECGITNEINLLEDGWRRANHPQDTEWKAASKAENRSCLIVVEDVVPKKECRD
jgi:hypothetical protein